ncbi:uncharacterized protein LOC129876391 [Solanum dulcamara]|uniref:uncharacterized protein LOC129876391 n=1 Tax=Solanum dulcamara TaxID=45834 RepID=UPI0024851E8F|nr:uncharacterized protein LOC129876391 [Solanum dulcamara]
MRIRKRFPPPPDPQLSNSVVVQLNTNNESLPSDLPNLSLSQPSDQPATVTGSKPTNNRWVVFGGNNNNNPAKLEQKDVESEGEGEDGKLWRENGSSIDNDNKKKLSFLSTPQLGSLLPHPSSSSDQDGRWCEEVHKVIPLKKRSRDSYHHNNNTSNINTMKSKTNKKCPQENVNGEEQEHEEHYRGIININSDHKVDHHVNKKNKRGSVILEGSRCSRVNGRGWRCCQQTLVGYSLCEHHLGKGRLRSINSTVRNSMNNKKKKGEGKKEKSLPNDNEYYGVVDDEENNKKKSLTTKKKMKKLGMVKARSLSSLLGQTDNAVAMMVVDNDDKNE